MKIVLDIGKREMILTAVIVLLVSSVAYVIAQSAFNPGKATHPLQKIARSESNLVSVDADNDNIIDNAEKISDACRLCLKDDINPSNTCSNGYNVVSRGIFNDTDNFNDFGSWGYPIGCIGSRITPESGEFWLCCK